MNDELFNNRPFPNKGETWKHFKGGLYVIIGLGLLVDNSKEGVKGYEIIYVIYENSRGEIFIRNIVEFMSEVDHDKYPDCNQKYRFELTEDEFSD